MTQVHERPVAVPAEQAGGENIPLTQRRAPRRSVIAAGVLLVAGGSITAARRFNLFGWGLNDYSDANPQIAGQGNSQSSPQPTPSESVQPSPTPSESDPKRKLWEHRMTTILDSRAYEYRGKDNGADISDTVAEGEGLYKEWRWSGNKTLKVWVEPATGGTLDDLKRDSSLVEVADQTYRGRGSFFLNKTSGIAILYTAGDASNQFDPGPTVLTSEYSGSTHPFPDPARLMGVSLEPHLAAARTYIQVIDTFPTTQGKL